MYTPEFVKPRIISVSQLNYYVKSLLDNDMTLANVFVTGEISNLKIQRGSGHIYFSLKDRNAVVRAVMFAGSACGLRFVPEDGMKVIARGRVSLYEQNGSYQIYIEDMQPDGVGALTVAFEQLKKKLEAQGLFAPEHKKPIPQFPKTVGVITSPTGAAVQDIRNIITRRFPCCDIVLAPVLVQGAEAPAQLIEAVNTFNGYDCADVIIIGRGGGSIEDLWAFNDENLAYAIYASNIPVISAVGHETDFTICDFVSDLRAPTPSAAAELAVPDRAELLDYYRSQQQYIVSMTDGRLASIRASLNEKKMCLFRLSPEVRVADMLNSLGDSQQRLQDSMRKKHNDLTHSLTKYASKLEALNPLSVLSRGYAVAELDGRIVNSVKEIKTDDVLDITLRDGTVKAKVVQ